MKDRKEEAEHLPFLILLIYTSVCILTTFEYDRNNVKTDYRYQKGTEICMRGGGGGGKRGGGEGRVGVGMRGGGEEEEN
ncbi:hypothetical protein PoB_007677500 [Plakobranchus ocellatus]|uniref:Glycine-rich protein n=1 Tax=Plakobranchus ocellatus TaxID=259542 RepID=A0AAV4E1V1_9GAST|nr:hypothetical protein PoB_007677500 [Plakobranchus ocellatus]